MKKLLFILILFAFTADLAEAQLWKKRTWELELGIGPSFSFPDVGGFSIGKNLLGFKDLSFRQMMFDATGSVRYRLSRTVNLRLSLTYATLHSTDSRGSNEGRKLESTTQLFEPALLCEYYFVKNKYESSWLFQKGRNLWSFFSALDFYAFAGAGWVDYSVNPNEVLREKGLRTSGNAAAIPFGLGATLIYTPDINFGLELGGRYTFTDYLDGYTSQYSKANDVYYFLNFTFTYKLKSSSKGLPSFR